MSLIKNQDITICIDSISNDGNGVGRYEGEVVFVPHTAVGDQVSVRIVKAKKTHSFGIIQQIISPGPGRQPSDCPVSNQCGGCSFLHLTYPAELAAKQGFVQDALSRIGKITTHPLTILPSPKADRYRNKVQFPVSRDEKGHIVYGFYAKRSHRIVPCEDCLLQPIQVNKAAKVCIDLLNEIGAEPYDEVTHKGIIRHLFIRYAEHTEKLLVCLVSTQNKFKGMDYFVDTLKNEVDGIEGIVLNLHPDKKNVVLGKQNIVLYKNGYLEDSLAGVPLRLQPNSFSQVNTSGAKQLFQLVKQYAAVTSQETLLDLYCGTGVIGLSMAKDCHSLIGVEIVPQAVDAAKTSAEQLGLTNTQFICADACEVAFRFANDGTKIDVAIVDPPRKGCDEITLRSLVSIGPKRIVMVSCNPSTLARDLAHLQDNGYTVTTVQPLDMFPRTHHVETVVLLQK